MSNLSSWEYYYNTEGVESVRANLVYTPYVSPDRKTFCMSFNRDPVYHNKLEENKLWTEELLEDRFQKELKFHSLAAKSIPTLDILDVDFTERKIFLSWYGDDFFMQGLKHNGYDHVLSDWKEQWIKLISDMHDLGIYKISLHPNSFTVREDILIPFNWFFCFEATDAHTSIRPYLIQISSGRQETLDSIDLDKLRSPLELQQIAFFSFKKNYPTDLIENALKI